MASTSGPAGAGAGAPAADSASASSAVSAPLSTRLREQIEFYFSDSNFRRDKFLRAKAAEDSDGYVSLALIATFARVKALTGRVEDLADALETSDHLELRDDRAAIRRVRPLPEEDDSERRSVYVKGPFPSTATLDDMQTFARAYGDVRRTLLRRARTNAKPFKGSIFVEFATEEQAKDFLAKAAAGEVVYNGKPIARAESFRGYFERKRAERDAQKAKAG
jgi:lupus La protein